MAEGQDLTKPLADPILLLVEGSAKLPPSAANVAPLDSLEEFDKICTIDVRGKMAPKFREMIDKERLLKELESQQNQQTEAAKRKKQNVLTRINNQWSSGPISILHRALTKRLRVKVWIRNHTTVRSILVAFVAAFDKHLNMALVDVDEVVLLCPATIKCQILKPAVEFAGVEASHNEQDFLTKANAALAEKEASASTGDDLAEVPSTTKLSATAVGAASAADLPTEENTAEQEAGSRPPKVTKASQAKRRLRQRMAITSSKQRFIPQLFVRGENVVMVAFADVKSCNPTEDRSTDQ